MAKETGLICTVEKRSIYLSIVAKHRDEMALRPHLRNLYLYIYAHTVDKTPVHVHNIEKSLYI